MGFKKSGKKEHQPLITAQQIFVGRTHEVDFFVRNILEPEDPTHNILSILGVGGVGKSTLLLRLIDEIHINDFNDYSLTAFVDDQQSTPSSIMEKFADQLHIEGEFRKVQNQYKEVLLKLQSEQETWQDILLQQVPGLASAAIGDIPIAGDILKAGAETAADALVKHYRTHQLLKDAERLADPMRDLTRAFIKELNDLADAQVTFRNNRIKRPHRIILFFDTFERLSADIAPWLLDYFLEGDLDISNNVVLVIASRELLERSIPDDPKRWLRYYDNNIIYPLYLSCFTHHETLTYLSKRGITDPSQINIILQLSNGLPLYLSLLTHNSREKVDPVADVVDNFLRWIPEQEQVNRRLIFDAALFSKPFNQDELEAFAYITEQERPMLYHWLIRQPFIQISTLDGRYHYQELARELFKRHLYQRSQKEYYATRRAIANYYQLLVDKMQVEESEEVYNSSEWLDLKLTLVYQLFLLPTKADYMKGVEYVLDIYQNSLHISRYFKHSEAIIRILQDVFQEQSVRSNARQFSEYLQKYIEADRASTSQELLSFSNNLLIKLKSEPLISSKLLAGIYSNRGKVYWLLTQPQQAMKEFNAALTFDNNYIRAYIGRGQIHRLFNETEQAMREFDHVLELDPDCLAAYLQRGTTYRECKKYQEALKEFDRTLEINPNYATAYLQRGITYGECKKYQEALKEFDHALKIDPDYAAVYLQRGFIYFLISEIQLAMDDFNCAIMLKPLFAWAYAARGNAYKSLKKYENALQDFSTALDLNLKSAWIYATRGETLRLLGRNQEAISDFDYALEMFPVPHWVSASRNIAIQNVKEGQQTSKATDQSPQLGSEYDWNWIFGGYYRGFDDGGRHEEEEDADSYWHP